MILIFNLNFPLIMKKFYLILIFMVVGFSTKAAPAAGENFERRSYEDAFIFVERGVEFAVFPDGQFDFFFSPQGNFNRIPSHRNYSFNSGYNYGPFVQYDDYGAVIQIENVPVYYDYYGRIIQAGRVQIRYNAFGYVNRIGNMFVQYDPYNHFNHTSGRINSRNTHYVYRPWHDYYVPPHSHFAVVYNEPYRLYYQPNRLNYASYKRYYHNNNFNNTSFQKSYYRPGDRVSSYHRGTRVDDKRQIRKHDASPGAAIGSTPRQDVNPQREIRRTPSTTQGAQMSTRTSRVETPVVQQQREVQQRTTQRQTVRENPSANLPVQKSVQQESRRSGTTAAPPARAMQRETSRNVRTERAATVEPTVEQKTVSGSATRSSRRRD